MPSKHKPQRCVFLWNVDYHHHYDVDEGDGWKDGWTQVRFVLVGKPKVIWGDGDRWFDG